MDGILYLNRVEIDTAGLQRDELGLSDGMDRKRFTIQLFHRHRIRTGIDHIIYAKPVQRRGVLVTLESALNREYSL
jgi:hypothetical protein